MSDARVQFLTIEADPCPDDAAPARFTFRCVHDNRDRHPSLPVVQCAKLLIAGATDIKRDGQNQNGGRAQWDWDGNREAPTFAPSINCENSCGWHGYIRNGRCVSTSGADEPE